MDNRVLKSGSEMSVKNPYWQGDWHKPAAFLAVESIGHFCPARVDGYIPHQSLVFCRLFRFGIGFNDGFAELLYGLLIRLACGLLKGTHPVSDLRGDSFHKVGHFQPGQFGQGSSCSSGWPF